MIIVGLGNPGKKFKNTRHNVGFEVIDQLAKKLEIKNWKKNKKANCFYFKFNEKIELVKPLTYMNNSGQTVKYIQKKHNLKSKDIIVIHDDIDIPLGKIKISEGSGAAGHKGVQSIIDAIGTKDFKRIRIGILPEKGKPLEIERFVLKRFTKKEKGIIKETVKKIAEKISQIPEHEISNS